MLVLPAVVEEGPVLRLGGAVILELVMGRPLLLVVLAVVSVLPRWLEGVGPCFAVVVSGCGGGLFHFAVLVLSEVAA